MPRKPTTLRLSDEEADALKRAAVAEKRAAAELTRVILVEWLEARGYLKSEAVRTPAMSAV